MTDFLSPTAARLAIFIGLLLLLMALEVLRPLRNGPHHRLPRWSGNLCLSLLGSLCGQAMAALSPVAVAAWAEHAGYGLLPLLPLSGNASFVLSLLLLDGLIWGQHMAFHQIPLLWRLHRVHHSDPEMDVTTAVRFHPLEILLSLLLKSGVAVLLGIPAAAMLTFEILLSSAALLTHANLRLPRSLDTPLRLLVITPDLHRIHHSPIPDETDSNFGFCLSLWDRLAGTLRPAPRQDHATMMIGLPDFRTAVDQRPDRLLLQPLQTEKRA